MIYLQLFISFFKIGLFGFGGGYAMLSLIQHEVVENHQWMDNRAFTDIIAVSQMTPGPIAVNSATYIGYTATGNVWGSILATTAVCLPSVILVLLICRFMVVFRNNRYVEAVFKSLRPATVGLIAAAALLLMNKENFIDYRSLIIFSVAFCLVMFLKIHPILMIILAGITGLVLY